MKKFKTVKFAALMLFVCAVLFCMKPVGVQASTMQTINTKRPCKSYDITGDNKKDSIQTKWAFDKYVSVIVNRKTIYKDKLRSSMLRLSVTADLRMVLHSYSLRATA